MLLIPRISEKAYAATLNNIYVFEVPIAAVKAEVKKAIEAEFKDVKVKDVRLAVMKGKVKASRRGKHARPGLAARKDAKKAYVTLAEGKIEIAAFKAEESAEAKTEKATTQTTVKSAAKSTEAQKAGLLSKRRTGRRGDK